MGGAHGCYPSPHGVQRCIGVLVGRFQPCYLYYIYYIYIYVQNMYMYVYLCVCSCLHTCVYVRVCTRIFSDLYVCLITMPTIPICSKKMRNQRCPVTAELNLSASSRVSPVSELSWQMRKPFRDPQRIHSRLKNIEEFAIQAGKEMDSARWLEQFIYHAYGCRSEAWAFVIALWWLSVGSLESVNAHLPQKKCPVLFGHCI